MEASSFHQLITIFTVRLWIVRLLVVGRDLEEDVFLVDRGNYHLQPLRETYFTLTELLSHTSSIMCHFHTEMRCKVVTGGHLSNPRGSEARWPLTFLWLLCLILILVAQPHGKLCRCQTVAMKCVFQRPNAHSPYQMKGFWFLSLCSFHRLFS